MATIKSHPAPGLGLLLPGSFVVPQNPLSGGQIKYIPKMGELLPSRFSVPQNPLIARLRSSLSGLGGCGCSGSGSDSGAAESDGDSGFINGVAIPGMGSIMESLKNVNWITVAIAAGAAYMLAANNKGR